MDDIEEAVEALIDAIAETDAAHGDTFTVGDYRLVVSNAGQLVSVYRR